MAQRKSYSKNNKAVEKSGNREVKIIIAAAVALFLELCLFNILGKFGGWIRYAEFGLFGLGAYIFPILLFAAVAFVTYSDKKTTGKIVCGVIFFLCLCAFLHMVSFSGFEDYSVGAYFTDCAEQATGGGIIGGLLALGLTKALSIVGAYIVTFLAMIVCLLIICEVPLLKLFKGLFTREYEDDPYDDEPDEEPDKVVRTRRTREPEARADYRESRPRRVRERQDDYYDEDYIGEYEPRRRRPANDDDELVYETTSDEGVTIRIVHSKKAHKRPRAELKRSANKAVAMRGGNVQTFRSKSKKKGVSDNVSLSSSSKSVDEIREITAPVQKETKPSGGSFMPVITDAPVPEPPSEPAARVETRETKPERKVPRQEKRPSSKITSETKITEQKPKKSTSKLPSDVEVKAVAPVKQSSKDGYVYPPMSLLAQRKGAGKSSNDEKLDKVARDLEVILENFGVAAKVIDRQSGPSVTRYELQPELGTRVSKITALEDDLKLNLAVSDIRIEAPIPGRAAIGIEIPNATKETVLIRDILEAPELINHKSKIAFGAGINISGEVVVADIAKMPHLLVAGTTGSGKSVFMNSIIMSILYRAKPSEVGLIIIDPKKIEFGVYSGIPHLVKDVVTDPGQAVSTLRWAVNEMTNRYQRMQLSGVRDFKSYNEKFDKGTLSSEEENPKRMPQIVIVIDELADLMMVASKEAEALICRLAQLARAAGIHLIIATQRPSVDVVTGLIKANIPARVALLVASQVDSRTIIDMKGAEELLGNGDMLFYPTGYSKPVRVQGAFVSDEEVANVVGFLKKNKTEDYFAEEAQQIAEYMNNTDQGQMDFGGESSSGGPANKQDEYLFEAGKLCIEMGKASSSMLQRHFSVGFNRAAKIIDQLTEMGAISPPNGAKPREILVDLYTFEEMFQSKE